MRAGVVVALPLDPKKRGSLEEQLGAVTRALVERGVDVTLVLARPPAPAAAELLSGAGARLEVLDWAPPLAAARQLRALLFERKPRLLHLHFVRAGSPLVLAARSTGTAVILNDHMPLVSGAPGLRRLCKRLGYRALAGLVECRVAVSRFVASTVAEAEAVPAAKLRVIENGVPVERFGAVAREEARRGLGLGNEPVIACVARMSPEKGVDLALKALARLRARREPPTLLLVGDGPHGAEYRRLAEALGVTQHVRFLGVRDDVERVLAACDQAWSPSRMEAFGLAAAEAMAARRAVVASRAGGLPEVVGDGVTGLLVPTGDDAALALAAGRLFDDPALRAALGAEGRTRAEARFSMHRYVDRVLSLYDEVAPGLLRAADRAIGRRPIAAPPFKSRQELA